MPDTPEPSPPTMQVLAGPNGAGKSTLYDLRLSRYVGAPFVNADRIQKGELHDQSMQGAYAAARIAEERRRRHLAEGTSFVTDAPTLAALAAPRGGSSPSGTAQRRTESTFSHPSKLALVDDAKAAGFRVIVHHVGVRSAALSIARVASRVRDGGHDVSGDKVVERFERNQPLIRDAVLRADRAFVYDNSVAARPPQFLIEFRDGHVHRIDAEVAPWAMKLNATELEHISFARQNPTLASFDEAARIAGRADGDGRGPCVGALAARRADVARGAARHGHGVEWRLPVPVTRTISLLSVASTPLALVVVGGTLVGLKLEGRTRRRGARGAGQAAPASARDLGFRSRTARDAAGDEGRRGD
jgi:predicted ABC-type ATPase